MSLRGTKLSLAIQGGLAERFCFRAIATLSLAMT